MMFRFARLSCLFLATLGVSSALAACGGSSASGPRVPVYPAGTVSDSGFRPGQDGLPFANYGDALSSGLAPTNLTPQDVQELFGGAVCADALVRKCDLIPEAQQWLDDINQAMSGGHCYGFSVLAGLLWRKQLSAATFGAADVSNLRISGNQALQRQIAYDWALQTLGSVQAQRVAGTPNKVLLAIIAALKAGSSNAYTLVFWKRDGTGGHAVTPYAVVSKGGGKFDVMIYDNNWPDQTRAISFDTTTNSWSYNASTNPHEPSALYEGDAKSNTIGLDPASPGLGTQPCPFCGKVPAKPTGGKAGSNTEQVVLAGSGANHANLVISDNAGHKIGYIHGSYVNQIRGAQSDPVISSSDWTNRADPDIYLPADRKYTLTLDGADLKSPDNENINVVGPSFDLAVKNIRINPGEKDTLVVAPDVTQLSYVSSRPESPTIDLGVSDTQADYSFEITGLADRPGSTINVTLPAEGSSLDVQTVGNTKSSLSVKITRETSRGVEVFQHGGLAVAAGDIAEFQFGRWTAGQPMPYTSVNGGTSSTLALTDQATQ